MCFCSCRVVFVSSEQSTLYPRCMRWKTNTPTTPFWSLWRACWRPSGKASVLVLMISSAVSLVSRPLVLSSLVSSLSFQSDLVFFAFILSFAVAGFPSLPAQSHCMCICGRVMAFFNEKRRKKKKRNRKWMISHRCTSTCKPTESRHNSLETYSELALFCTPTRLWVIVVASE